MNYQKMTKKQLDNHAEAIGVKLDRRKSKKDMIVELNKKIKAKKAPAKKPVAKKAPAKKPVAKKAPAKKAPAPVATPAKKAVVTTLPKTGVWATIKKFFS